MSEQIDRLDLNSQSASDMLGQADRLLAGSPSGQVFNQRSRLVARRREVGEALASLRKIRGEAENRSSTEKARKALPVYRFGVREYAKALTAACVAGQKVRQAVDDLLQQGGSISAGCIPVAYPRWQMDLSEGRASGIFAWLEDARDGGHLLTADYEKLVAELNQAMRGKTS